MLAQMKAAFMARGVDAVTATERAYAALHGMLLQQASMVSFVWLFRLLGGIFLMLLPLILIMRRPKGRVAAAAH
jgi:DHA2 family multidrug resistance protein